MMIFLKKNELDEWSNTTKNVSNDHSLKTEGVGETNVDL
jgi:hypothetical protein